MSTKNEDPPLRAVEEEEEEGEKEESTKLEVPQHQPEEFLSPIPSSPSLTTKTELQPVFFGSEDMSEELKTAAVNAARAAIKLKTNRERAESMKKHFDKNYNVNGQGKWHCIVGLDFGSYVTHESQNFIFFRLGAYYFLLFKA